jgi:hypothetical protein
VPLSNVVLRSSSYVAAVKLLLHTRYINPPEVHASPYERSSLNRPAVRDCNPVRCSSADLLERVSRVVRMRGRHRGLIGMCKASIIRCAPVRLSSVHRQAYQIPRLSRCTMEKRDDWKDQSPILREFIRCRHDQRIENTCPTF